MAAKHQKRRTRTVHAVRFWTLRSHPKRPCLPSLWKLVLALNYSDCCTRQFTSESASTYLKRAEDAFLSVSERLRPHFRDACHGRAFAQDSFLSATGQDLPSNLLKGTRVLAWRAHVTTGLINHSEIDDTQHR